jgi:hypothetical protein
MIVGTILILEPGEKLPNYHMIQHDVVMSYDEKGQPKILKNRFGNMTEIKSDKTLYAVPWIDIEYGGWGSKPDGYLIFDDLSECIRSTKKSSEKGGYSNGYHGPEKPLCYYEIPSTNNEGDKYPFATIKIKYRSEKIYIS